jgi:hypothetical protein
MVAACMCCSWILPLFLQYLSYASSNACRRQYHLLFKYTKRQNKSCSLRLYTSHGESTIHETRLDTRVILEYGFLSDCQIRDEMRGMEPRYGVSLLRYKCNRDILRTCKEGLPSYLTVWKTLSQDSKVFCSQLPVEQSLKSHV